MPQCVRCFHNAKDKESFCVMCGAPLKNLCTNDGGPYGDACGKANHPSAAYCEKCGSPTTFNKAGLVAPMSGSNIKVGPDEIDDFSHFNHKFFTED